MSDDRMQFLDAVRWGLRRPHGAHVLATSWLGKTRDHVADEHPEQHLGDGSMKAAIRAHFRAHRADHA